MTPENKNNTTYGRWHVKPVQVPRWPPDWTLDVTVSGVSRLDFGNEFAMIPIIDWSSGAVPWL